MNNISEAQNTMMHQMQSNHHANGAYHPHNFSTSLPHEPATSTNGTSIVNSKRPAGLPPTPPNSFTCVPLHSRSSSQPSFFSLDTIPPLAPSPALSDGSGDTSMEEHEPNLKPNPTGLPPRKAHRRSRSDVPFAYFQSGAPPLPPPANWGLGFDTSSNKPDGEPGDDLFNSYLNLDTFDALNSSDEKHDDMDSHGSSMKTNGAESSENESENSANESGGANRIQLWANYGEKKEGLKRNAAGEPANGVAKSRHARSLSMDSLMGKLNFADPLPSLPPSGQRTGAALHGNASTNGSLNKFSLEFGSAEFTANEMKKIMADEKLAEMALADPKRVKRVLANRQSAARSKERKMRYIAELEQKVQILQTEATTLSTQLTLMQRDSAGLANQNNELKFRLQAMEQQAQLRDALNEALTAEVQRLKLASAEMGESCSSNNLSQQVQNRIFELQQQEQPALIPFYQLQQPQQNGSATNEESKK
ncbi:Basic-leucine zipper (bZIP) transcription factor family protein [Rhynchospora pubera]|uniref:Basic-leucine zipper (BZIP) transcription factor family protein n=1 Tax=Rhynchospora pubera TaxID=906938 RepID=A0AAV8E4T3_9POAL|nr:Basic-leucine zipper (bZIP) transcription factor family protein [Rhynchospora pubera]